jgi:hypothetical protein
MGYTRTISIANGDTVQVNISGSGFFTLDNPYSVNIPLLPGQTFTAVSLSIALKTPPHLFTADTTVKMNGQFVGTISSPTDVLNSNIASLLQDVRSKTVSGKNNVDLFFNTYLGPLQFQIYATLTYTLNDNRVPPDPTVNNPGPTGFWDFFKDPFSAANLPKTILLAGAVGLGLYFITRGGGGGTTTRYVYSTARRAIAHV